MNIHEKIGVPAVLEQCAEECTELAQICLKMARKMRGENPTPMNYQDILVKLNEEMADVMVCMQALVDAEVISYEAIDSVMVQKEERWEKRVNEKEEVE